MRDLIKREVSDRLELWKGIFVIDGNWSGYDEKVYQKLLKLNEDSEPGEGMKNIMALNRVIRLINRMSEDDRQKFYRRMARKVKDGDKPRVSEEFIERLIKSMDQLYINCGDLWSRFLLNLPQLIIYKFKEEGFEVEE